MFKVQLFEEKTVQLLQETANEWLQAHKDIAVVQSGIAPSEQQPAAYALYLLYTTATAQAEELKEIAADIQPQDSLEASTINPDILTPTS